MYFQKHGFLWGQDLFDYHDLISNSKVNKDSIKQLFDEILEKVNLIELNQLSQVQNFISSQAI